MPDTATLRAAKILWEYMRVNQPLKKSDCILAMGSHDLRVAAHAAALYLQGWAPMLVCSGGHGNFTRGKWKQTEAEMFAEVAIDAGVPKSAILLEKASSNTGENVLFSCTLLEQKGLVCNAFILAHKPYMERRAYATFRKLLPTKQVVVTSPPLSLADYPTIEISLENTIQIMVGDFQRILLYPKMGFQIPQRVPAEVMAAYKKLIQQGFDAHFLPNERQ